MELYAVSIKARHAAATVNEPPQCWPADPNANVSAELLGMLLADALRMMEIGSPGIVDAIDTLARAVGYCDTQPNPPDACDDALTSQLRAKFKAAAVELCTAIGAQHDRARTHATR